MCYAKKEGVGMVALQGYYDGNIIQTLEKINAKKNQKVIVTVLDEFIEDLPKQSRTSAKGLLSEHANKELIKNERTAWERAIKEKYETA